MAKVNREVAEAEVTSWLDKKKIKESQREAQKAEIETMIDFLMDGDLTVDESTNQLTQILLFPIGESGTVKQLTYKARLNDKMVEPFLKGVNLKDGISIMNAYTAALTDTNKSILSQMDSVDNKLAKSITSFFL